MRDLCERVEGHMILGHMICTTNERMGGNINICHYGAVIVTISADRNSPVYNSARLYNLHIHFSKVAIFTFISARLYS